MAAPAAMVALILQRGRARSTKLGGGGEERKRMADGKAKTRRRQQQVKQIKLTAAGQADQAAGVGRCM